MRNIKTSDGVIFSARTDAGIVSQMRRDMWSAPDLKADYMGQVAAMVAKIHGLSVRTDSPTAFLDDLASAKLIERI